MEDWWRNKGHYFIRKKDFNRANFSSIHRHPENLAADLKSGLRNFT
jgi:hypothetical protein